MKKSSLKSYRRTAMSLLLVISSQQAWAHVKNGELARLLRSNTAIHYLTEGFLHIVPYGYDHILFVFSLFLLSPKVKSILWQTTTFTIAHSMTLGFAMFHIIDPRPNIIEPLISLSILYVAIENIYSSKLRPVRMGVVFFFGLIHGMGFAGALRHLGLPDDHYLLCLIMFNVGVELGQILVIIVAYLFIARWFADKPYYRKNIAIPVSAVIALTAFCWTIQRLLSCFLES